MRDARAWAVSLGLHGAIAATFFVTFSFSSEILKKDKSEERQKIQMESLFVAEQKENLPVDKPTPNIEQKQPKAEKPKHEEAKETPLNNNIQNAPALAVKKEESSTTPTHASAAPAQKKSSFSENDKKLFLAQLKQAITKNIIYPDAARRRSMQGEVNVHFVLLPNGTLGNIRIDSGHSVFHKAAINAIENTKVTPPSSVPLPMELSLTLSFELDKTS